MKINPKYALEQPKKGTSYKVAGVLFVILGIITCTFGLILLIAGAGIPLLAISAFSLVMGNYYIKLTKQKGHCPYCGKKMYVKPAKKNRTVQCKKCKTYMLQTRVTLEPASETLLEKYSDAGHSKTESNDGRVPIFKLAEETTSEPSLTLAENPTQASVLTPVAEPTQEPLLTPAAEPAQDDDIPAAKEILSPSTERPFYKRPKSQRKVGNRKIVNYVVIDIETTGLKPETCDIIEIGAVKVQKSRVTDTFSTFVRLPEGVRLDPFIVGLTGITEEMLKDAPTLEEVIPKFMNFIGDFNLIGHNVTFDLNFLYDAAMRVLGTPISNAYLDTLSYSRRKFPEYRHHKLENVAKYCGIEHENAHRAANDCMTVYRCYEAMKTIEEEEDPEDGEDDFQYLKTTYARRSEIKAKDIKPRNKFFNEAHPFYGKTIVFTGQLSKMTRLEAMQRVADVGAVPADNVTKKTDFLVIGSEKDIHTENGKSTKERRAEELIDCGCEIETLDEFQFDVLLNCVQLLNV